MVCMAACQKETAEIGLDLGRDAVGCEVVRGQPDAAYERCEERVGLMDQLWIREKLRHHRKGIR